MKKYHKIGGIVFTIDPEGKYRLLLRRNRPFNGHIDHWTVVSGSVETGETSREAAEREIAEEFSINEFVEIINLEYQYNLHVKGDVWEINNYAFKVTDIDVKVVLDWESIGYNWVTFQEAKEYIKESFVARAIDILAQYLNKDTTLA